MSASFSTSLGIDQVNKLPELQSKYAQGLNGALGSPVAAASSRPRSWGPSIDSLVWVADPTWIWDKNGKVYGKVLHQMVLLELL